MIAFKHSDKCYDAAPETNVYFVAVARIRPVGAGQVLRDGQEGEGVTSAAVPRMERQRQLCSTPEEEEEEKGRLRWWGWKQHEWSRGGGSRRPQSHGWSQWNERWRVTWVSESGAGK